MNKLLFALLLLASLTSYAQDDPITDNLLDKICHTITASKTKDDSTRLADAVKEHLSPVFGHLTKTERIDAMRRVQFRLQMRCPLVRDILDRLYPQSGGDWKQLNAKPVVLIDTSVCKQFSRHHNFFYKEGNGDTVELTIRDNNWIDHFKDGTRSDLSVLWITPCEFQITFISSTNISRMNLSRPGDKYFYQIVDKKDGFYLMSLEIQQPHQFGTFNLYFKD